MYEPLSLTLASPTLTHTHNSRLIPLHQSHTQPFTTQHLPHHHHHTPTRASSCALILRSTRWRSRHVKGTLIQGPTSTLAIAACDGAHSTLGLGSSCVVCRPAVLTTCLSLGRWAPKFQQLVAASCDSSLLPLGNRARANVPSSDVRALARSAASFSTSSIQLSYHTLALSSLTAPPILLPSQIPLPEAVGEGIAVHLFSGGARAGSVSYFVLREGITRASCASTLTS